MIHIAESILVVTSNHYYKDQIRLLLAQYRNFNLILVPSTRKAIQYIQQCKLKLILLDENLLNTNLKLAEELLILLEARYLNTITILVSSKVTRDTFAQYLKFGITYIADMNIARYMIPAVLEYIEEFNTKQTVEQRICYKGLAIYPKQRYIYIKNCKIFLSKRHFEIISFLVFKNGKCSIDELKKHLLVEWKMEITNEYITVNISRLNKRIFQATGLKIIKNRYGVGYYISI